MQRHEEPVHMVDRQSMEEHISGSETPDAVKRQRIRGEISMADHRAFGASGGARGVDDRREIGVAPVYDVGRRRLRMARHHPSVIGRFAEGDQMGNLRVRRRRFEAGEALGPGEEDAWLAVLQEVGDLGGRISGVEGNEDGACAQCREVEGNACRRLVDLRDDALARLRAEFAQAQRHSRRLRFELAIGDRLSARQRERARILGAPPTLAKETIEIGHGIAARGIGPGRDRTRRRTSEERDAHRWDRVPLRHRRSLQGRAT